MSEAPISERALALVRANPGAVTVLLLFTLAGVVGGMLLPLGEISTARRILGGAIAGFFFGMCPLGARLYRE